MTFQFLNLESKSVLYNILESSVWLLLMALKMKRQLLRFSLSTFLVCIVLLTAIANETAALLNNLISSWQVIKYLPVAFTQTLLILKLQKRKSVEWICSGLSHSGVTCDIWNARSFISKVNSWLIIPSQYDLLI